MTALKKNVDGISKNTSKKKLEFCFLNLSFIGKQYFYFEFSNLYFFLPEVFLRSKLKKEKLSHFKKSKLLGNYSELNAFKFNNWIENKCKIIYKKIDDNQNCYFLKSLCV